MAFGKKNHLVGLDIGSRMLKVAEISETKKGHSLKKFGTLDIAPGLIEEGVIKEPGKVADAIQQLFSLYNLKENNVAISMGGYSVIVKNIEVQSMTEEQLQETIHYEAEQYIPFNVSDVNLDFQILGEHESNPNLMHVLLVAAKKEIINDYINLLQMAGLNPCIIDVDAFALQNVFEANYDTHNENTALIDIGAGKTSLNILKKNNSVFLRDVSLGCAQINQKIISQSGCTFEEAEQIKFGNPEGKISTIELREIITSVVGDWCLEIRRALDFFYSTYPDEKIQRIVLSGGGANIKEFQKVLAEETSADVEPINPFKNFIVDEDRFDSALFKRLAPQAAISMGLAIRRVNDK